MLLIIIITLILLYLLGFGMGAFGTFLHGLLLIALPILVIIAIVRAAQGRRGSLTFTKE